MRDAGRGTRDARQGPTSFGEVMRQQGMQTPGALERAMSEAIGDANATSPDELLTAAERLLERVLDGKCESRDSALDLLTVDALVTRAMELAARDPELLASFPELAMKRISAR